MFSSDQQIFRGSSIHVNKQTTRVWSRQPTHQQKPTLAAETFAAQRYSRSQTILLPHLGRRNLRYAQAKNNLSQEPCQDTFNHINGDGTTQRTLCPSERDNDDVDDKQQHRPSLRPSERLTQPHENEASNSDRQESSIITKGAGKSKRLPNHKGCQKRGGTITANRKARRNNHIEHAIERVC